MNTSNPQCEVYIYAKIYKNVKSCSHYPGWPYHRRWRGYSASTDKRQQQQTSSYNRHMHRS